MTFIYSLKSVQIVLRTLFYLMKYLNEVKAWKACMTFAPVLLFGVEYAGMSM